MRTRVEKMNATRSGCWKVGMMKWRKYDQDLVLLFKGRSGHKNDCFAADEENAITQFTQ